MGISAIYFCSQPGCLLQCHTGEILGALLQACHSHPDSKSYTSAPSKPITFILLTSLYKNLSKTSSYSIISARQHKFISASPCIHALPHLAPEVVQIEPRACSTQWAMECSIDNLREEI